MGQTEVTNADLAQKVVGAVSAVQDAQKDLVEGAKQLAGHLADKDAHNIAEIVQKYNADQSQRINTLEESLALQQLIAEAGKRGAELVMKALLRYGELFFFRNPDLLDGFEECNGGVITNAALIYPDFWQYIQTEAGQLLCKTEAEWQALSVSVETGVDGHFTSGWEGIGGVGFFAPDFNSGSLRLPDLRGCFPGVIGGAGMPELGHCKLDKTRSYYAPAFTTSILNTSYPGDWFTPSPSDLDKIPQLNTFSNCDWGWLNISPTYFSLTGPAAMPKTIGMICATWLGIPQVTETDPEIEEEV